jgi:hypothetical protein
MKIGSGTSYWPIRQTPRAISQDIGRVSYNLKPITKTKTITRKEKTNEVK